MNYFFLYETASGKITQPYLGNADQWTNIPPGQIVIGPFSQDTANATVQDAYNYPDCYTVQTGVLTPLPNIDQIKSQKAVDLTKAQSTPKLEDRIASLEAAMLSIMGL